MAVDPPERRDIRVTVLLSASEFVALTALCEAEGLSQSSALRMWALRELRSHARTLQERQEPQD